MKIGVTGSLGGIGKAFCKLLDKRGIDYCELTEDISTAVGQERIIEQLEDEDCDMFFNNANDYGGAYQSQIQLLYKAWDIFKFKKSKIICTSSLSNDVEKLHDEIPPMDKGKGTLGYDTYKHGLDYACKQLNKFSYMSLNYKCKVINIRPGLVDTDYTSDESYKFYPLPKRPHAHKIDPNYLAGVILWTIEQPEHIMSITIADDQLI